MVNKCHTTTPQGDGGAKLPKSKLMFNQPITNDRFLKYKLRVQSSECVERLRLRWGLVALTTPLTLCNLTLLPCCFVLVVVLRALGVGSVWWQTFRSPFRGCQGLILGAAA